MLKLNRKETTVLCGLITVLAEFAEVVAEEHEIDPDKATYTSPRGTRLTLTEALEAANLFTHHIANKLKAN